MMTEPTTSEAFERSVRLKFQLYNSLFLTLPFDLIHQTGTLLPLLKEHCVKGYAEGRSPGQILDGFFSEYLPGLDERGRTDVLFNFIKYIERQVVLFDAVEEAAFDAVHDMEGPGTLEDFLDGVDQAGAEARLEKKITDFRLHLVLTAHPTQFYPGKVLGIISDLAKAIRSNDLVSVKERLLQLGKTPFINRENPTPLDEARSLIWYLENVFYQAVPDIIRKVDAYLTLHSHMIPKTRLITLGFWPGGDRDGNPFVTAETTRAAMALLHRAITSCYHREVRGLRRRLTFEGVYEKVVEMEYRLFDNIHMGPRRYSDVEDLQQDIQEIRKLLIRDHNGLFAGLIDDFQRKVALFGFHFATLDVRQDSRKHEALLIHILKSNDLLGNYDNLGEDEKIRFLNQLELTITVDDAPDDAGRDIIGSVQTMHVLQDIYGELACHRYIISNTRSALDIVTLLSFVRWITGTTDRVDVVPLFESVETLRCCGNVMNTLYRNTRYMGHLRHRGLQQVVMLGFSDGTKDGGYVAANWSIFCAKEALTEVSREQGVRVIFFDGRGGPPARGGGNTHKFYASLGQTVENHEVQVTVQGQTISSHYGSLRAARYNLEQLFTAGLERDVFHGRRTMTTKHRKLLERIAASGYQKYADLKSRPEFLRYLEEVGTLSYYAETKIGSRPVSRGGSSGLTMENLRAIPFVGAWSQLKQNVPGFYGFGHALHQGSEVVGMTRIRELYRKSSFFQTLVGNSMQSLSKSFFALTGYLSEDKKLGLFWRDLEEEYHLTLEMLLSVSEQEYLLQDAKDIRQSIAMREEIILPVLTIQQAAIQRLRKSGMEEKGREVYRKLIVRCMFGIINAGRNSA